MDSEERSPIADDGYETPRLEFIGPLRDLTTGGSGSRRESNDDEPDTGFGSGGGDDDDDGGDDDSGGDGDSGGDRDSGALDTPFRYAGLFVPKLNAASSSRNKRP